MAFSNIHLRNFRCFDSLSIDLSSKTTLFYGKNGCGKTSILESIYVASSGRSFRTSNLESLIKKGSEAFVIRAYDDNTGSILEVKKGNNKPINIKINNSRVTISELVRAFPLFPLIAKLFFIMTMLQNTGESSLIEVFLSLLQTMRKTGLDIFAL